MAQRPPSRPTAPAQVLDGLNLGYNGYTDPTLANPKMWSDASNVISGAFGFIERCRFARIVSFSPATGLAYASLKYIAFTNVPGAYLLGDLAGKLYSYDLGSGFNYSQVQRFNPYVDPTGAGSSLLNGPFAREVLQSIVYEMNGQIKSTGRGANALQVEGWGLDAPDAAPQISFPGTTTANIVSIARSNGVVTATLSTLWAPLGGANDPTLNVSGVADTSFNGTFTLASGFGSTTVTWNQFGQNVISSGGQVDDIINKTIGRSYAWAWENANKTHVGPPSPATQYIQYSNQKGLISLFEVGTVTYTSGSTTVVGTNTQFTLAWVGRNIWVPINGNIGMVASVTDTTHLTLVNPATATAFSASFFQIYDLQATHIRLYATADGGATYFRIARNAWVPASGSALTAGLEFYDSANSEPPDFPFTTETAQDNNLPPPIGAFLGSYQGRIIVFGVDGEEQSFFYSNQESTTIGLPQESFAPLNQVTLPIPNSSISGWIEYPGAAVIFSDKQDMFRLTGLLVDNTVTGIAQSNAAAQQGAQITRLPYAIGCATPFAAVLTPLGGIWLTPNAEVWLFTDTYAPRNIGRPIQDILDSADMTKLGLARMSYYHSSNRNWLILAYPANAQSSNSVLFVLDLDLLASNGSPSYFTFDMASNSPSWYVFNISASATEIVYEGSGLVRAVFSGVDLIDDLDFHGGFGAELSVPNATVELHAWGNDSAFSIKRPSWVRFNTNRDPSMLADDGWSFEVDGIDDDFYTFFDPLRLLLVPGVNDTSTLGGNPDLLGGSPYRHSPELYRFGGINFIAGRRLKFRVNFPSDSGKVYRLRNIQLGFGTEVPN